MIKFTIQGKPHALKRHRTYKGRQYDPSKDDKRVFALHCDQHRPKEPFDFPLHVYLQFHFDNHKSEPDVDNCIKFVFDALNGIFWKDDKIIHRVTAVKVFDGNARTEVIVMEVNNSLIKGIDECTNANAAARPHKATASTPATKAGDVRS